VRGEFVEFPHEFLLKEDKPPLYHNSFFVNYLINNLLYHQIVIINQKVNTIHVGLTIKTNHLYLTIKIYRLKLCCTLTNNLIYNVFF